MIFDHRPPSEILDFIAESEDVEDVIADSALRFRLFHVDIISGLRVRDRGRLASLTKYLPEAVVQEIVDEHNDIGRRVDAIPSLDFLGTVKQVWKNLKPRRRYQQIPGKECRLADIVREQRRLPTPEEILKIYRGHEKHAFERIATSNLRTVLGLADCLVLSPGALSSHLGAFEDFIRGVDENLSNELCRQIIYGLNLAPDPKVQWIDDLKMMALNCASYTRESSSLAFLMDQREGRRYLVRNDAPGSDLIRLSLSCRDDGLHEILKSAIVNDDVPMYNVAQDLLVDERMKPSCIMSSLAHFKCIRIMRHLIEERMLDGDDTVTLLFSIGSLWPLGCVEEFLRSLKELPGIGRFLKAKDCFGNSPLWYVRYREADLREKKAVFLALVKFGFDEDARNDMSIPMRSALNL